MTNQGKWEPWSEAPKTGEDVVGMLGLYFPVQDTPAGLKDPVEVHPFDPDTGGPVRSRTPRYVERQPQVWVKWQDGEWVDVEPMTPDRMPIADHVPILYYKIG